MAKTPAPASSTSGVSTAEAKPRRSKMAQAGRGDVFIMPRLSGVEAAALMRAAGIVDSKDRLTKFYRQAAPALAAGPNPTGWMRWGLRAKHQAC